MRGAIPPLPNAPSWRGAQIRKAQGQLYSFMYLMFLKVISSYNCHSRKKFRSDEYMGTQLRGTFYT
jgi:hypothetical protein